MALLSLRRARLRSLLTALGISIGIAAVVVVVAIGRGAREQVGGRIASLGSNVVYVFGRPAQKSGARGAAGSDALTIGDAEAIRREASAVSDVTVYTSTRKQLVTAFGNAETSVVGTDLAYFPVRGYAVEQGRLWTAAEEQNKARLCLIGLTAAQKLFAESHPIGRTVRVGPHPYRVIGTLEPKGQSPFGEDQDDRIIIPITSYMTRVVPDPVRRVQMVMASAKSAEQSDMAKREIDAILRQRHGIREGEEVDFRIRTQEQVRQTQDQVLGVLSMLLMAVALVSLFVGGVGVTNIMLVSVTEQQREIGVRMAVGARPWDIEQQFLTEAVALTAIGGAVGLAMGITVLLIMERGLGWTLSLGGDSLLAALFTSLGVGTIFGYLPARRAARLEPMEALRHE